MSDKEQAAPLLGRVLARVTHLPLAVVPKVIQDGEDKGERLPVGVTEKPANVLKQKKARALGGDESCEIEEESTASVRKASASSGDGVRLAREPRNEEIEGRDGARVEARDVAIGVVVREVVAVDRERGPTDFAEADARVVAEGELEAASAGEGREVRHVSECR
ncbi:MAG TPA: hypothetical protein VEU30_13255 [Thermoanaerobaculia bacterium]|nr:hypothetical protein [Thermoanaerobaculia bacterium]